jgi:polyhydroxybutyrate depolymerase
VSASLRWLVGLAVLGLLGCNAKRPAPQREVTAASLASPSAAAATPGSGCGKPARKLGERRVRVGDRTGAFIVSVPSGYDPQRRYPLGFAFHGRNRNHVDCQKTDCTGIQSVIGEQAVLVYPQSMREPIDSQQGGWEWPTERDDNVRLFEAVWAEIERDFCIDDQRVFLTGTSSGGTFANLLGCRYAKRLLAVAPISGGWTDPAACAESSAALVIHGIDDPHVPIARGELARDSYQQRSSCSATSLPSANEMHAAVRQARDAKPSIETVKCVDYQGCSAKKPLRWCEHSYGGYDGSTHGWPPVGGQLVWDFVARL